MISIVYRSFGRESPSDLTGLRYCVVYILCVIFMAVSLLILAVINFFSLFFGVTVNFLGRNGVKFTFLHLFGRLPFVAVTLPALFGYAIWHNVQRHGALVAATPGLLTAVFAVAMLGGLVLFNNLMRRRQSPAQGMRRP